MSAAILTVDIGTSRTRARLFHLDGSTLDEASRPASTESPFPGAVELDCEALWQDVSAAVASVCRGGTDIVAMGVTAQLGVALLNHAGALLGKAMLWADTRAQGEAQELALALGEEGETVSGRRMAPELVAPRLLWFRRRQPDVFSQVARIVSVKDFVVERLTGAVVTDETHASYSGLFDVAKRSWSRSLMQRASCNPRWFPPVGPADGRAGFVKPSAAEQIGVAPGIPVAIGASDGTAGAIGAGAIRGGITVDVAGTTDVVLHCVEQPLQDPTRKMILNAHAAPGTWTVGGPTGFTGGAVSWALKLFGILGPDEMRKALSESLTIIPPGSEGLVFHTALTGSRFPGWDGAERGSLHGIEVIHGVAHILRAAQEGAAFTVADAVDAIQKSGARIAEVIVVGGLSTDRAAVQLRADAIDIPVSTLMTEEASSAGSAMLTGVCAKVYPDLTAAADRFVRRRDRFEPNPAVVQQLARARQRWNEVARMPL